MYCKFCGETIPAGRIEAIPGVNTCTGCSTTPKVGVYPVITGKTTYSQLEVVPAELAKKVNKALRRKGTGVSEGVRFRKIYL